MPLLHEQDDKWTVLDALVRHTVHCVLFQDSAKIESCRGELEQQVTRTKAVCGPEALPALLLNPVESMNTDDASAQYASYCKRVLECQHWTNAQLQQEKRALKTYLQLHYQHNNQQQRKKQTQVSTELYYAYEAYALVKLFHLERKAINNAAFTSSLQQQKPSDKDRFLLVLHVQLELYNKYFEHAQQRKVRYLPPPTHMMALLTALAQIRCEDDIQPIETLYAFFCEHQQQLS